MVASGMNLDEDALVAAADLVGRTGAKGFEIGFLHDDVPVEEAAWYAHAQFDGARITEEGHVGPVQAAEALARRLLEGGKCTKCGGLVALSSRGAWVFTDTRLTDGTRWTADQALATKQCRWTRMGNHWVAGCQRTERTSTGRTS